MTLSDEEKFLIANHIASFTARVIGKALDVDEQGVQEQIDEFHSFVCTALEAAKRDARYEAMVESCN